MKHLKLTYGHLILNFFISLIRMTFSLIFAVPGLLMLLPLGMIISFFAEKERRKALATSSVKVRGVDVMASVKVGSSILLYPIYCTAFTMAFYMLCSNYFQMARVSCISWTVLFVIFFPIA